MAIQTYSGFNHSFMNSVGTFTTKHRYGGRVFSPTRDIYITRFDYCPFCGEKINWKTIHLISKDKNEE